MAAQMQIRALIILYVVLQILCGVWHMLCEQACNSVNILVALAQCAYDAVKYRHAKQL